MIKRQLFVLLFLLIVNTVRSQVAIGKDNVDGAGILDFVEGTTSGIILPIVEHLPEQPSNGTFLMDKTDGKVKMFEDNEWVDLSDIGDVSKVKENKSEELGDKVVIGDEHSESEGVLVLETENKALILPKISSPDVNVKNPYPGMICYDENSKTLAVFDGKVWNYWR